MLTLIFGPISGSYLAHFSNLPSMTVNNKYIQNGSSVRYILMDSIRACQYHVLQVAETLLRKFRKPYILVLLSSALRIITTFSTAPQCSFLA